MNLKIANAQENVIEMVNNAPIKDKLRFEKYGINNDEIKERLMIKLEHVNKKSLPADAFFSEVMEA